MRGVAIRSASFTTATFSAQQCQHASGPEILDIEYDAGESKLDVQTSATIGDYDD